MRSHWGELFAVDFGGKLGYIIYSKYMEDYEKTQATIKLISELEKGRISGDKEGWFTIEEVRRELKLNG
ncbi:hypothetical protein AGMMS50293_27150 [Spirochaetia bacterium]|nr:hypothetical protein AGMMS50293_27150 [Spirochaetia bacterium]